VAPGAARCHPAGAVDREQPPPHRAGEAVVVMSANRESRGAVEVQDLAARGSDVVEGEVPAVGRLIRRRPTSAPL